MTGTKAPFTAIITSACVSTFANSACKSPTVMVNLPRVVRLESSPRNVFETDQFEVLPTQALDGSIGCSLLAELLGKDDHFLDKRCVVPRSLPDFLGSLQLDMQRPAHWLAEEVDACLGLLSVHTAAADGVLDLLAHRLLDGIDGDRRCRLRLGFPVGGENVLDHFVLQDENILVTDVPWF